MQISSAKLDVVFLTGTALVVMSGLWSICCCLQLRDNLSAHSAIKNGDLNLGSGEKHGSASSLGSKFPAHHQQLAERNPHVHMVVVRAHLPPTDAVHLVAQCYCTVIASLVQHGCASLPLLYPCTLVRQPAFIQQSEQLLRASAGKVGIQKGARLKDQHCSHVGLTPNSRPNTRLREASAACQA